MLTSKLEKLGVEISRLGFGAMRLPLLESGEIDHAASVEMIDLAYKSGVNYFDTAYGYHSGKSELFLRDALKKYPRESYFLADKLPTFLLENESDADRLFDEQLEKCGVDYFDFYLLHSLGEANLGKVKQFSAMDKMLQKKKEGKIKYLGFSYHGDFKSYIESLDMYDWDFVQLQFNYIDYVKQDAKAFNDELVKRKIPMIVMEPVRGGFLASLPQTALDEMGAKDNSCSADWALRWCASMDNSAVILSGMSNLEQVKGNISTFENFKALTEQEFAMLDRVRDRVFEVKTVPCTSCGYCMDCPSGVDIPKNMQVYNDFKLYGNPYAFKGGYNGLAEGAGKNCVNCGICVPLCPQNIDIPTWLTTIDKEHAEVKL